MTTTLSKSEIENAVPAERAAGREASGPVVSVLTGDRACISCGFNLVGQQVTREPVYGMLLVRCPECNTAASLQEYPLLGKWASRWGAVLAAGWLLGMLVWGAIGVLLFFQIANTTVVEASSTLARELVSRQSVVSKAQLEELKTTDPELKSRNAGLVNYLATQAVEAYGSLDVSWYKQQDLDQVFSSLGGWRRGANWGATAGWVYSGFVGIGMGMVWSVALSHVRGWRLVLVPLTLGAFALAMTQVPDARSIFYFDPWGVFSMSGGPYVSAYAAARPTIEPVVLPASILVCAMFLCVGVWTGRPIARLAVRGLLAPRLRGTLAFLWLCDGKKPPAVGPVYRSAGVPRE